MNFVFRAAAILKIAVQRIAALRGLALATALGLAAAVALTMSIPLYADGIYQHILEEAVAAAQDENPRPAFAFLYRYVGTWTGPVDWERLRPINDYLSGRVVADLRLPPRLFVRYIRTDTLMLFSRKGSSYNPNTTMPLDFLYLATLSDLAGHVRLLEGQMPGPVSSAGIIDVLMQEDRAAKLGVHVGETYTLLAAVESGQPAGKVELPVRVSGIWRAADAQEAYWFYPAEEYNQALLVPEETFTGRISPALKNAVSLAVWYWVMDPAGVQSANVPRILSDINRTRRKAESLLPKTRLDVSPEGPLTSYQQAAGSLKLFLYALSIPLLLMTLVFVSLIANMVVGQRRNEIAILRSRGSSIFQLAGMALIESILLGLAGLAVGAPSAGLIAQFFSRARSFLDFSAQSSLPLRISLQSLQFGAGAAVIAAAAQLLPTIGAARTTIVDYKRDRSRQMHQPWWRRAWLDLLLSIPAIYGAYLLIGQGGRNIPLGGGALTNDPFQNPLLLLVPALAIFAVTLFILRVLPLLMRLLAWVLMHTRSVGMLMAARYLARSLSGYSAPLVLLVMTLSLATFTATMARTLDRHMIDQAYYQVGADVSIQPVIAQPDTGIAGMFQKNNKGTTTGAEADVVSPTTWFFLPVSDYLKAPGVSAAAQVAYIKISISTGQGSKDANYMAIDRLDFPRAAFWRDDFAGQSLGALMNQLGSLPEGVLVSRSLLAENGLAVGDLLVSRIASANTDVSMNLVIVGVFDYFPTWYPADGPLVVGNLDYLFDQAGGEFPYKVLIKAITGADLPKLKAGVRDLYRTDPDLTAASTLLSAQQRRPERQGLFGLFSVGFATLAMLTVIGFLLYALFSFQRRFIELGLLRAIGLSAWQMLVLLASELAFLFLIGLLAGTVLGAWVSSLFIPHLQVGSGLAARIPPFLVQIDWTAVYQIYALFGLLFLFALVTLIVLLIRMKIFQAIKMGEAV